MKQNRLKEVEVTVNQKPVSVSFMCEHCGRENKITYKNLVGMLGEPPDWTGSFIKCQHCGQSQMIVSQSWD